MAGQFMGYHYVEVRLDGCLTVKRVPKYFDLGIVDRNERIRKYLKDLGYKQVEILHVY